MRGVFVFLPQCEILPRNQYVHLHFVVGGEKLNEPIPIHSSTGGLLNGLGRPEIAATTD